MIFIIYDKSRKLSLVAVKFVVDILYYENYQKITKTVQELNSRYTFGIIVFGPGNVLFKGLTIKKRKDRTISIDDDGKFNALEEHLIDRIV